METAVKEGIMRLRKNLERFVFWIEWLLGRREIVESGEPRFADCTRASLLFHRSGPDDDAYLTYKLKSGYSVEVELTQSVTRIGCFPAEGEGVDCVVVEDPGNHDVLVEIIKKKGENDGIYHYYVKSGNDSAESNAPDILFGKKSLSELSQQDASQSSWYELKSEDIIQVSALRLTFFRRRKSTAFPVGVSVQSGQSALPVRKSSTSADVTSHGGISLNMGEMR